MVLADTSEPLEKVEAEIGMPVGQLLTPLTKFRNRGRKFGIDNGSFAGFDSTAFRSLLLREDARRGDCLFVVCPDIVSSARRTLELFDHWAPLIGPWPLALAAQDGQEDLPIPWERLEAIFIGGSTEWKMSKAAEDVIRTGKAMGKWVHVGRVNTPLRLLKFLKLNVDSCDGTGISRYSWMRQEIADLELQPELLEATA